MGHFLLTLLGLMGTIWLFFAAPIVILIIAYELAVLRRVRSKTVPACILAVTIPVLLIAIASSNL